MHSFHRSRGRTLFEVFCALGISASCVAAWMQTGATALLPAAAIAALFGVVHLFDLRALAPTKLAESPKLEVPDDALGDLPKSIVLDRPATIIGEPEVAVATVDDDSVAPRKSPPRRTKAPRKKASRPAPAGQESAIVAPVPEPVASAVAKPLEEAFHPPLAPLFEPEPFVRQQRTVFGRKAG